MTTNPVSDEVENPTAHDNEVSRTAYETESDDIYSEYSDVASYLHSKYFDDFMEQSSRLPNMTADDPQLMNCFFNFVQNRVNTSLDLAGCPVKFDGLSCWPRTSLGVLREIPCFEKLYGILYDTTGNASLFCHENGTWAERASYNFCSPVDNPEVLHSGRNTKLIFYIGNSLSLVAVLFALWIFVSFKDLRCLRNTIHTNLLATYLLQNLFWLISATWQSHFAVAVTCLVFACLNYCTITNFMWMFVEGLYLYMLVVQTFVAENIKLRVYILIGWAVPIPIVLTWIIVRLEEKKSKDALEGGIESYFTNECALIEETNLDWIVRVPVLLVLTFNIVFLVQIMWVLITKLRSANTLETQRYWKATKALLVLIPLLGLTYMLLIALPQQFEHFRAILISTQGFWVAIFYCFLNSEVRNSIRHHIERWRTERGIAHNRGVSMRNCRGDTSPHSRAGRLGNCGRRLFGAKRESLCCSEVTTMTTFITNGYNSQPTSTPPQLTSQSAAVSSLQAPIEQNQQPLSSSSLTLQPLRSVSLTPSMAASCGLLLDPPQRAGSEDAML